MVDVIEKSVLGITSIRFYLEWKDTLFLKLLALRARMN